MYIQNLQKLVNSKHELCCQKCKKILRELNNQLQYVAIFNKHDLNRK